jgi:hypothetical protein
MNSGRNSAATTVPSQEAQPTQQRCVNEQGFSLHAEVRCGINQCHKLEHLCHYITRPTIANDKPDTGTYRCQLLRMERLKHNREGQVMLQLKSPYHDGTIHSVMSPLELRRATRRAGSLPWLPLIESIHPWIGRQRPCC